MTFALIYHDIARPDQADEIGFPGAVAARYKLEPDRFEAHLEAITACGADVAIWRPQSPANTAALTFDDGGASALESAAALERRGWRGHYFITTARIGTPGFLSADGVRELAARGHAVGSHSHTHPTYMGRLSRQDLDREWRQSRSILGELLGAPPIGASVPGGFYTHEVATSAAEAGYEWMMTSEPESRVDTRNGLAVTGRYTIWSTTPAATAAAYARGDRTQRARLWVEWKLKQRAKRISPRAFELARRLRAGAR